MKRRTLVDTLMEEVILYGGLPMRRGDVYHHALKVLRTHIGSDNGGRPVTEQDARRGADQFAFGLHTRVAPLGTVPMTLAEVEAIE